MTMKTRVSAADRDACWTCGTVWAVWWWSMWTRRAQAGLVRYRHRLIEVETSRSVFWVRHFQLQMRTAIIRFVSSLHKCIQQQTNTYVSGCRRSWRLAGRSRPCTRRGRDRARQSVECAAGRWRWTRWGGSCESRAWRRCRARRRRRVAKSADCSADERLLCNWGAQSLAACPRATWSRSRAQLVLPIQLVSYFSCCGSNTINDLKSLHSTWKVRLRVSLGGMLLEARHW